MSMSSNKYKLGIKKILMRIPCYTIKNLQF